MAYIDTRHRKVEASFETPDVAHTENTAQFFPKEIQFFLHLLAS